MAEQQQPMASPLSGGYLLIILAEPHSEQHKEIILKRLAQGKVLWHSLKLKTALKLLWKKYVAEGYLLRLRRSLTRQKLPCSIKL